MMRQLIHRYEADGTPPTRSGFCRDLARRALLPAIMWWAVVVGIGLVIVGPLGGFPAETAVNRWFVGTRAPALDSATAVLSAIGSTPVVVAAALASVALVGWLTRRWWVAILPAVAVSLQALVFLAAAPVVDRDRPDVERLDDSPPTSSFPSGHTGASTALYVTLALLAQRIGRPVVRRTVTVVALLVPVLVGYGRLYRGMHHPTDVVVGALNGLVCAWLAWGFLRRDGASHRDRSPVAVGGDVIDRSTGDR